MPSSSGVWGQVLWGGEGGGSSAEQWRTPGEDQFQRPPLVTNSADCDGRTMNEEAGTQKSHTRLIFVFMPVRRTSWVKTCPEQYRSRRHTSRLAWQKYQRLINALLSKWLVFYLCKHFSEAEILWKKRVLSCVQCIWGDYFKSCVAGLPQ